MSSTLDEIRDVFKRRAKPKPKPVKKSNFTMSPLLFLAREVAIMRNSAPMGIRAVTKALVNEFRYAHKHNLNVTFVAAGGPGKGKTRFCILMGKLWIRLTGGEFVYCWDIDEIPDANDGDHLHIDEWLIAEGEGKIQSYQRLKNLFDTGRAKQISISVATPTTPNLPFVSFEATTIAQDWDNRMNQFEIHVPLPRFGMVYVGDCVVPLGKDDELWKMFDAETKSRKDEIWTKKGKKVIKGKINARKIAKEVLKWAKENNIRIRTKSAAKTFIKEIQEERGWDITYYNMPDITNWIMEIIKEDTKVYEGQTVDLKEALYTRLQDRGVKSRHIEWLRLYVAGEGQTDVARKFEVTQQAVSDAIGAKSDLRLNNLGYAFEDVWYAYLKEKHKRDKVVVVKGGDNTPEPDILIKDESGKVIGCHSLKCYISKSTTVSISIEEIAASELELLDKGVPVKLVFFDVVGNEIFFANVSRDKNTYKFLKR